MTSEPFNLEEGLKKGEIFETTPEDLKLLQKNELLIEQLQPFSEKKNGDPCARGPCMNNQRRVYLWYENQCYRYYRVENC